ncbi:MAG: hemolysin III family protein [Pseudomonadota bacterium]|nr:hemolysin III family protein [Pseudomonadota bacterium]
MDRHEAFNSLSHLAGAALAIAGLVVLLASAANDGDAWKIVSFSVYGTSLFSLFLVSTLYHGLNGRAKRVFRVLDHQAIYLLIAGTYTPYTLVTLRGPLGWTLFGTVWGVAILGLVLDTVFPRRGPRIVPIFIYLILGWLGIIALPELLDALSPSGFTWLLAGGILYSAGVIFYVFGHWQRWGHGVWHVFVLAASASHYFGILLYT